MMSAHLIVDLAFCVGVALAFNPTRRFVKRFISSRTSKVEGEVKEATTLSEKLTAMLADVTTRKGEVDIMVEGILQHAEDRCKALVERGRKDLETMLGERIDAATGKIEARIDGFVRTLRLAAAETAASATAELFREERDANADGGEITSLTDSDEGLSKKLH
ncbi:hypothetical protein [Candidatus Anaplasma sp. TIGMIC]|uniref:F0F1 ATP synthase subunit B family protein n=1 Tax=Candidatus Anaplasma sp. TIGMIC TaxID=3020713 RepID=UPI00232CD623|nr:hypothetical protein [Candidatus Anaplasma sp. TIGMIC]MDB1135302.1 hypothetical protein [Candidatus Anaplasma sp. TIGMIC]